MHVLEIIKLKFGKKMPYIVYLYFGAKLLLQSTLSKTDTIGTGLSYPS